MKLIIIILLYLGSAVSSLPVPGEKKEPRFFLVFSLLKSTGPLPNSELKIFEKPSMDSKLQSIKSSEKFDRLELILRFYDKKEPFDFLVVASTEKKGDFYKVFFDGKYVWVHTRDLKSIYSLNDYFKRIGAFGLDDGNYKWAYEEIGGKNIIKEKFLSIKSQYSHKELEENDVDLSDPLGEVDEVKIVKGRAWLKVNFCFTFSLKGLDCRGDFSFWFRPYDNNGRVTNWSYAAKETSLYP